MENDNWENWSTPNDDDEISMASLILKHTKIIDPEIVKLVVEDNNKKKSYFKDLLDKNKINPDIYIWDDSPIAFPGIRRHVGAKEISVFRKKTKMSKIKTALCIDDNSFPKMIWAFIMTGKKFSVNNSPEKYSLAHIIDHKDYKTKREYDILNYKKPKPDNFYAGMFTNIVNTIYIHETLLKPTDFNNKIRNVFIQLIDKHYGNICNILPHEQTLKLNYNDKNWNIDKFPLPTKVGNKDYVSDFLEFRKKLYKDYE